MTPDFLPVTPGNVLEEEFMKPMGLSQYALAKALHVPAMRISEIVRGKRAITAETALRLGRFFSIEPAFWLNLQNHYDLERIQQQNGTDIVAEVHPFGYTAA